MTRIFIHFSARTGSIASPGFLLCCFPLQPLNIVVCAAGVQLLLCLPAARGERVRGTRARLSHLRQDFHQCGQAQHPRSGTGTQKRVFFLAFKFKWVVLRDFLPQVSRMNQFPASLAGVNNPPATTGLVSVISNSNTSFAGGNKPGDKVFLLFVLFLVALD